MWKRFLAVFISLISLVLVGLILNFGTYDSEVFALEKGDLVEEGLKGEESLEDWSDFDSESEVMMLEDLSEQVMGVVRLEEEFLNGDLLKISVNVADMLAPVLGVAFHLDFDEKALEFLRYDPGSFLEMGGDPFYLVQDAGGKLFFGETLRRGDSFPLGSGELVHFYFQIIEEGPWSFSFSNAVVSSLETVRQDIDRIIWEDKLVERIAGAEGVIQDEGSDGDFDGLERGINSQDFSPNDALVSLFVSLLVGGVFLIFLVKMRRSKSVNFK